MRRLELEVLKQLRTLTKTAQGQLYVSEIDVDSFYGIEFEEFPAQNMLIISKNGSDELMIPEVEDFFIEIDEEHKKMYLALPDGLY